MHNVRPRPGCPPRRLPVVRKEEIEQLKKDLARDLGEDVHNLDRISKALHQLQGQGVLGPYGALLLALTGVSHDEEEAVSAWQAILGRRREQDFR